MVLDESSNSSWIREELLACIQSVWLSCSYVVVGDQCSSSSATRNNDVQPAGRAKLYSLHSPTSSTANVSPEYALGGNQRNDVVFPQYLLDRLGFVISSLRASVVECPACPAFIHHFLPIAPVDNLIRLSPRIPNETPSETPHIVKRNGAYIFRDAYRITPIIKLIFACRAVSTLRFKDDHLLAGR